MKRRRLRASNWLSGYSREYYAACFWHLKPDLVVTESTIPLIVKGLRAHGGRKGLLAAAELQQ